MSDSEGIEVDDGIDVDDGGDGDGNDEGQWDAEGDQEGFQDGDTVSSEQQYQQAKDNTGFDDDSALGIFWNLYVDEEVNEAIRVKSLCRSGCITCNHDDIEQIQNIVGEVFSAYELNLISIDKLRKYLPIMTQNSMHSEEVFMAYLDVATNRLDKNNFMNEYLDLKLRQIETKMKYSDYTEARDMLLEVETCCPYPPDPDNASMCKAMLRILLIKIELADLDHDEKSTFECYKNASTLNQDFLDIRQKAQMLKIQGEMHMRERNFKEARTEFSNAFKGFDSVGSDNGRLHCLPYLALAGMLLNDKVSIFLMPEVMHFIHHPLVAPVAQLRESFDKNDVVLFNQRMPSALKLFNEDDQYRSFLDEIRQNVLRSAILQLCPLFSRLTIDFIGEELKTDPSDVEHIVIEMIENGQLEALFTREERMVTMHPKKQISPLVKSSVTISDCIAKSAYGFKKYMKIPYVPIY